MEDNKASAPGILKKSTASAYSMEEKLRNLEKKVEEYKERLSQIEDSLFDMFDGTEEIEDDEDLVPVHLPHVLSWMPDNEPRVTQRDRELAIWRAWTKYDVDLYCDERINDL